MKEKKNLHPWSSFVVVVVNPTAFAAGVDDVDDGASGVDASVVVVVVNHKKYATVTCTAGKST